jgi:DNA-binding NtrC family response regulator
MIVSRAMTELLAMARRAAKRHVPVLLTGESGVGKDLVARYIHSHSIRRLGPFVSVNCAGLAEARVESELFGHRSGSVAEPWPEKRGKLRLAHRGTLFLDKVGDMVLHMQACLLRFLMNGETHADGSEEPQAPLDVRVIAAASRNLNTLVATGQFRQELLYRLRGIHLHLPPLRERPEDIHALMRHFLARSGRELTFTDDARRALLRYHWPGNVRELQNVIEQLACLSAGAVVGVEQLPISIRSSVTAAWEEELAAQATSRLRWERREAGSPKGGRVH